MNHDFTVYVVGLCFGQEHITGMLEVADQFCEKNFPGSRIVHILVDNKMAGTDVIEYSQYECIAGDNKYHEFSGWQKGLGFIKDRYKPSSKDVCLLINDTVHRRNYSVGGDKYYEKFAIEKSLSVLPERWAAGYLDDFPKPTVINGLQFTSWIRSNFVIFNWACIDLISPLVFPFSPSLLFSDCCETTFWKADAPMSENWKAYISSWLFGIEDSHFPEYRLKWLKSQPFNRENCDSFKRKAICILSEHYLTARLQHNNVVIYDFNIYPKLPDRHLTPYYT